MQGTHNGLAIGVGWEVLHLLFSNASEWMRFCRLVVFAWPTSASVEKSLYVGMRVKPNRSSAMG